MMRFVVERRIAHPSFSDARQLHCDGPHLDFLHDVPHLELVHDGPSVGHALDSPWLVSAHHLVNGIWCASGGAGCEYDVKPHRLHFRGCVVGCGFAKLAWRSGKVTG
jgi:hypothetical protein